MNEAEELKRALNELIAEKKSLLEILADKKNRAKNILEFGTKYQKSYSKSIKIVQALAPDRSQEFCSYYLINEKRKSFNASTYTIQDYVNCFGAPTDHYNKPEWDIDDVTGIRVINQIQILESLEHRIDGVLSDVAGHLFAELQDAELEAARKLVAVSLRAAGSLAGVVLERHLQQVASNRQVQIGKKNPTISDLNDPLKQAGALDVAA